MTATIHELYPASPTAKDRSGEGASGFLGSDAALVSALLQGSAEAPAALYDRYSGFVDRVLIRVLGSDPELRDLLHEVFAEALSCIHKLNDPTRLKSWIAQIAVYTARGAIRRRRRGRWLKFRPPEAVPEQATEGTATETLMLNRVYALLEKLPTEERIAFSLRRLEDMELRDAASAMNVSLATFKRRLSKAEARFLKLAMRDPFLADRALASRRTR